MDTFSTLVELLQEVTLTLVFDFFVVGEAFIASIDALTNWHDLIKENTAPNISVLHAVETIVATGNEAIDLPRVSHFVMLTPVPGKLKLGLLGGSEFAKTIEIDNEWHVSTVFPEKSKTLHVRLREGLASAYIITEMTLDL